MIRLLLVDDHTLVRSGFHLILDAQQNMTVAAEAENGLKALQDLAQAEHIDLILTDIHMEGMDGIELIQQVKKAYPTIKIIVLSMEENMETVYEAFRLGADGYMLKSAHVDEILFGIQLVLKGERYICSTLSMDLIENCGPYIYKELNKNTVMSQYDISERDLSVLELIAEGYTNAEIADKIFLSKRTVEGHRQQLIEKTNSKNTAGLVRFGFQKNLIN